MELRQLEYFVAVAEEAGFTRAADRVRISQPGVSAQIRRLERELGAPLFDRSTRTATLTRAGEAALVHARAALAGAAAVRAAVDEVNGLVRGRLVVGMVTACEVTPLFEALAAFHRAHPGIGITLREDGSDRLIELVLSGEADVALVGTDGDPPPGLSAFTVVRERLVAAVPDGHPLLDGHPPALAAVNRHPIVCLPEGTGIRTVLDRACAERGLRPGIALQAAAPGAVIDLARRGLGVAILSESMVGGADGLRARLIDDVPDLAVLALVWADRPPAPALRELVRHARRAFGG
ncbi:LysR family transcriptional regulator [Pseudonocardia humida]|uniref:LysR family transcriptional regulator n=1 Tax=Pseudonocardia humida TaxID=2800819 RepID=A0ABT0ZSG0_9PSEU|nr:LysR substrate-binding domain-containing protein [Pseudonocardia humida]MCO1653639.1 LysR family transcriptional regulator [Pseudonocardia humida]